MRSVPLPFLSKITLLWTRAREPGPVSPVKVDSPLPFPWTQRGEIYKGVDTIESAKYGYIRVCSKDQNEERQRIAMAANPLHNKQWYLLLLSAVTDN